jgi:hypothetical protein
VGWGWDLCEKRGMQSNPSHTGYERQGEVRWEVGWEETASDQLIDSIWTQLIDCWSCKILNRFVLVIVSDLVAHAIRLATECYGRRLHEYFS